MPGHFLATEIINNEAKKRDLKGKIIIEIGSAREKYKYDSKIPIYLPKTRKEIYSFKNVNKTLRVPECSTEAFIILCKKYNMKLISVDMDPDCLRNAQEIAGRHNFTDLITVHAKGEIFLKEYTDKIDFLYLDAFDWHHKFHTQERQNKYKKYLNSEITADDKNCHKMHLDCCKAILNKIDSNGYIIFDDILDKNASKGKGVTAIPFLLKNNFKKHDYDKEIGAMSLVPILN